MTSSKLAADRKKSSVTPRSRVRNDRADVAVAENLAALDETRTIVGRAWVPAGAAGPTPGGPRVVSIRPNGVFDLSPHAATMSDLLDLSDPAGAAHDDSLRRVGSPEDALRNAHHESRNRDSVFLLAPADLQAVKGVGVTFAANALRRTIRDSLGDDDAASLVADLVERYGPLEDLRPGGLAAKAVRDDLVDRGSWTPYLEVALGKEPEVFTKAVMLCSRGPGELIGIRGASTASQPESELVIFYDSRELPKGVSLGNDLDFRDFEDRSPYLVAQYKDSYGGAAIGPWIRLFDSNLTPQELLSSSIHELIVGDDGLRLEGEAIQSGYSRDLDALIEEVGGGTHHFPDGLALFMGCSYVPEAPRGASDGGFRLLPGDMVKVAHPEIGALCNWVGICEQLPPPEMSVRDLIKSLPARG